jgi:hypothetical protein
VKAGLKYLLVYGRQITDLKAFFLTFLSCAGLSLALGAAAQNTQAGCSAALEGAYPKAAISNGAVQAVLYLPDAKNGYYRAARFDWSGVIPCLTYKGHTYFGVWFSHYDPMIADAITGPVEEFRSADGGLDYDKANQGGLFVKPGVGVLRRTTGAPYKFMYPYPLVDGGKWTVHASRRKVIFRQQLKSPIGYAYDYEKTVSLDSKEPILTLHHTLKNTGAKTIDTQVYDHDFFMLDGAPSGPGMVVRFPFTPVAEKSLAPHATIEGKQIVYKDELQPDQYVESYLTGYSNNPSDYDITVEDTRTGVGVEQTGDNPISLFNYWSPRTTMCPEAYHHLVIAPGQTAHWDIHYRFFAK